jgi:predicted Zn-dependent peptidase
MLKKTNASLHAPSLQTRMQGNDISIIERTLDQTHFTLGFYAEPASSKNRFAISLLTKILGGSMSSRLFQRVREDLGAAYYVGSSQNAYATHGYVDVFAGVNHGKLEKALEAIMKEITAITQEGVTTKELRRAQDYSIGTFMLSLESSSDMAFYYGQQETVLHKIESPKNIIEGIKAVSIENIQTMARKIFNKKTMKFAIIGPYKKKEEKKFRKLLRG